MTKPSEGCLVSQEPHSTGASSRIYILPAPLARSDYTYIVTPNAQPSLTTQDKRVSPSSFFFAVVSSYNRSSLNGGSYDENSFNDFLGEKIRQIVNSSLLHRRSDFGAEYLQLNAEAWAFLQFIFLHNL